MKHDSMVRSDPSSLTAYFTAENLHIRFSGMSRINLTYNLVLLRRASLDLSSFKHVTAIPVTLL